MLLDMGSPSDPAPATGVPAPVAVEDKKDAPAVP
jgi:hypothetical protein